MHGSMPAGLSCASGRQTPQRKGSGRLKVAHAMFVMDGERLAGLASHVRRAGRKLALVKLSYCVSAKRTAASESPSLESFDTTTRAPSMS